VAKRWVKLGPIFGIFERTVGDLTNILVKFSRFWTIFGSNLPLCDLETLEIKHFWRKTSHGTVERPNLAKIKLFFFFLENLRCKPSWRKGSEKKVQFSEFWYAQWEIWPKFLSNFRVFEQFLSQISHCAIEKRLKSSIFEGKFPTVLWNIKIWPKSCSFFFFWKTLGVSHRGEKVVKKRSNFRVFGKHSGRFDLNFVQIFGIFAFLNSFWVKSPSVLSKKS